MPFESNRYRQCDREVAARIVDAATHLLQAPDDRGRLASLYAYLDILDRKAASFVTLNSVLFAIGSLFVFRPLVEQEAPDWANPLVFGPVALGIAGLLCSLVCVVLAVHIFSIRWGYMGLAQAIEGGWDFADETVALACECARRTRFVATIRRLTLWATVLTFVAAPLQVVAHLQPAQAELHNG